MASNPYDLSLDRPHKKTQRKIFFNELKKLDNNIKQRIACAIDNNHWELAEILFEKRSRDPKGTSHCEVHFYNKKTLKQSPIVLSSNIIQQYKLHNIHTHEEDIGEGIMTLMLSISLIWYDGMSGWSPENSKEFIKPYDVFTALTNKRDIIADGCMLMLNLNRARKNADKNFDEMINNTWIENNDNYEIYMISSDEYTDATQKMEFKIFNLELKPEDQSDDEIKIISIGKNKKRVFESLSDSDEESDSYQVEIIPAKKRKCRETHIR